MLLVRVAERPRERRAGLTALPRWHPDQGVTIDWVPDIELESIDPRVVRRKNDGLIRLTFLSHLRVVCCGDGRSVQKVTDICFTPQSILEEYGVEDPRITPLDGRFFITYVAVSRHGVATALASTTDFRSFERHGIIFGPENKDVVLFPEKCGGDYLALHRPSGSAAFARPEMWLARSPDLIHWGRHEFLWGGVGDWATGRVGAGTPPLKTPGGWLKFYHGNRRPLHSAEVGTYAGGALLLDLDNPARVLSHTPAAVMVPETDFERHGFVPNVVFPTGVVETGETLLVYYGAADTCTGVIEFSRAELLAAMTSPFTSESWH